MKIIILGAGRVGTSLAQHLAFEGNDITLVDTDQARLMALQEEMDIQTLCAHGAHPSTLLAANAEAADMLIAVTQSDEVNMIACQIAHTLFKTPLKIARIRSTEYTQHTDLYSGQAIPIDVLISPEQIITTLICQLIEYPDALQVLSFSQGLVKLVALKVKETGELCDKPFSAFFNLPLSQKASFLGLYRQGLYEEPDPNGIAEPNDIIYFLTTTEYVSPLIHLWHPIHEAGQRVIIAGGGNVGKRCSEQLNENYQVKMIEKSDARAQYLAENLHNTLVLKGDATDKTLLLEADIESSDIYCALTQVDEANILSALLAKKLGAKKVMALINNPAFVDIMENSQIDHIISPQEATIGNLLTHIRRGDVVNVYSLAHGAAEAIEGIVHGTAETSRLVGKSVADIELPKGSQLGAIIRQQRCIIPPTAEIKIQENDRVIFFLSHRESITDIEKLFQIETVEL